MESNWRRSGYIFAAGLIILLVVWFQTLSHMISILWDVEAFAHGLLAPVVSISLIWSRRTLLAELSPGSSWIGVLIVTGASLLWLSGTLLDFALFQHIALVTAVQGLVIGSFGISVYRHLLFPMLFLYFSVPFGYELVTPLQHLTASLVIGFLDIIGAEYSAQGMLITLPSGIYEVAEACAGVKFLFTSIFTGVLLANLLYDSWKKRLAVLAGSIVLPIAANAVRVLLIFLIAELSDQRLAKGFDHLVYGWVFLSIVLFTLISVAYRYADKPLADQNIDLLGDAAAMTSGAGHSTVAIVLLMIAAPTAVSTIAPQRLHMDTLKTPAVVQPLNISDASSFRILPDTDLVARPSYLSAKSQWSSLMRHNGVVFRVHLASFESLGSGQRIFQPGNSFAPEEWKQVGLKKMCVTARNCNSLFTEIILRRGDSEMLAWTQYSIEKSLVFNSVDEKLVTAWARLRQAPSNGKVIVLSAPLAGNLEQIRASFREFLSTTDAVHDLNGVGDVNVGNGGLCAG